MIYTMQVGNDSESLLFFSHMSTELCRKVLTYCGNTLHRLSPNKTALACCTPQTCDNGDLYTAGYATNLTFRVCL